MTATARITGARVAATHDGSTELIVELRYENGGITEVALDQTGTTALMENCGAASLDDLKGHTWDEVKQALEFSWNRFNRA